MIEFALTSLVEFLEICFRYTNLKVLAAQKFLLPSQDREDQRWPRSTKDYEKIL